MCHYLFLYYKLAEETSPSNETRSFFGGFLGLQVLKRANLHVLDEGVEFGFSLLVFIAAASDADTDLTGHISDTV